MRISILTIWLLLISYLCTGCIEATKPSADVLKRLEAFKQKRKFVSDARPQLSDPALGPILIKKVNQAADEFMQVAKRDAATDQLYQQALSKGLSRFEDVRFHLDTEDREWVCSYFEELMDIVGLESSNGQLNKFMYDFDPTELLRKRNGNG